MDILLSIKKKYSDRIFSGQKRVEYRKRVSKEPFENVLVYESEGIGAIIGEFSVEGVICGTPDKIWAATAQDSGVSKEEFDSYFSGHDQGFGILIGKAIRYDDTVPLSRYGVKGAPQGYVRIFR